MNWLFDMGMQIGIDVVSERKLIFSNELCMFRPLISDSTDVLQNLKYLSIVQFWF